MIKILSTNKNLFTVVKPPPRCGSCIVMYILQYRLIADHHSTWKTVQHFSHQWWKTRDIVFCKHIACTVTDSIRESRDVQQPSKNSIVCSGHLSYRGSWVKRPKVTAIHTTTIYFEKFKFYCEIAEPKFSDQGISYSIQVTAMPHNIRIIPHIIS